MGEMIVIKIEFLFIVSKSSIMVNRKLISFIKESRLILNSLLGLIILFLFFLNLYYLVFLGILGVCVLFLVIFIIYVSIYIYEKCL